MTILEAITRADRIRPNELEPAVKLRWLSTLDGQVCAELLGAFEATGDRQQATGDGGRGLPRQCAHWLAMTGSEADSAVGAVIDRPPFPAVRGTMPTDKAKTNAIHRIFCIEEPPVQALVKPMREVSRYARSANHAPEGAIHA